MGSHYCGHGAWKLVSVIFVSVILAGALLGAMSAPAKGETPTPDPDVRLGPATIVRSDGGGTDFGTPLDGWFSDDEASGHDDNGKGHHEECWTWDESELGFFEKLNEARRRHEVGTVKLDPELSKVAQHHSYNMKTEQRLYHTPESKLRERVTKWEILGENVGRGGDVDSLHRSFMESDAHREVFLHKDFNYVGVGVSYEEGVMWVTILLEGYEDPGTTMEMDKSC